jgi:hypothetical protein
VKASPLALMVVTIGLGLPLILGGLPIARLLVDLRWWSVTAVTSWFVVTLWLVRRLHSLAMRTPGSRLDATEERDA